MDAATPSLVDGHSANSRSPRVSVLARGTVFRAQLSQFGSLWRMAQIGHNWPIQSADLRPACADIVFGWASLGKRLWGLPLLVMRSLWARGRQERGSRKLILDHHAGVWFGSMPNCRAALPPIMRAINGSGTLASRRRASASQALVAS